MTKYIIFYPGDMWFGYIRSHIINYLNKLNQSNDSVNNKFTYLMYTSDIIYEVKNFDQYHYYNDSKRLNISVVANHINNLNLTEPTKIVIFTPGYSTDFVKIDPSYLVRKNAQTEYIVINDSRIVPYYDHTNEWSDINNLNISFF